MPPPRTRGPPDPASAGGPQISACDPWNRKYERAGISAAGEQRRWATVEPTPGNPSPPRDRNSNRQDERCHRRVAGAGLATGQSRRAMRRDRLRFPLPLVDDRSVGQDCVGGPSTVTAPSGHLVAVPMRATWCDVASRIAISAGISRRRRVSIHRTLPAAVAGIGSTSRRPRRSQRLNRRGVTRIVLPDVTRIPLPPALHTFARKQSPELSIGMIGHQR